VFDEVRVNHQGDAVETREPNHTNLFGKERAFIDVVFVKNEAKAGGACNANLVGRDTAASIAIA
jgi:hypothetical protein